MKKISSLPFCWQELLFAGAMALSPYLLAWLVLSVTQG
jgi:hypothetical protein